MADRRRMRLGLPISSMNDEEKRQLDVLSADFREVEILARAEAILSTLQRPGGSAGCIIPRTGRDLGVAGPAGATYRQVSFLGQHIKLHRLMVLLAGGELDTRPVLHHCDVKSCVRLDCLDPINGSARANVEQAVERGWIPRGQGHPRSTIADVDVIHARRLARRGATIAELVTRFGGSMRTMRDAVAGDTYGHLDEPAVRLLPQRRLSDVGVSALRYLARAGVEDAWLAERTGLTSPYVRSVVTGTQRSSSPGPISSRPQRARGEDVATARLNAADTRLARHLVADGGCSRASVARLLDVSASTIARAVSGATWGHLDTMCCTPYRPSGVHA